MCGQWHACFPLSEWSVSTPRWAQQKSGGDLRSLSCHRFVSFFLFFASVSLLFTRGRCWLSAASIPPSSLLPLLVNFSPLLYWSSWLSPFHFHIRPPFTNVVLFSSPNYCYLFFDTHFSCTLFWGIFCPIYSLFLYLMLNFSHFSVQVLFLHL